jgi:hypothetical protein
VYISREGFLPSEMTGEWDFIVLDELDELDERVREGDAPNGPPPPKILHVTEAREGRVRGEAGRIIEYEFDTEREVRAWAVVIKGEA